MKKYGVVLADPPWFYVDAWSTGRSVEQYPLLKLKVLESLPVEGLLARDSVLLLWCTWPKLPTGVELLKAWGFDYVTGFPWVKVTEVRQFADETVQAVPKYGIGWWAKGASEPLLVGRRGKPRLPKEYVVGLLGPSFAHSRKPADVYEYAELLDGPYLELFARQAQPGWDYWGNEVESTVELEFGCPPHEQREPREYVPELQALPLFAGLEEE